MEDIITFLTRCADIRAQEFASRSGQQISETETYQSGHEEQKEKKRQHAEVDSGSVAVAQARVLAYDSNVSSEMVSRVLIVANSSHNR